MNLFRDGDRYIKLTGESPKGFKGVLFVCWAGTEPSSVVEIVAPVQEVQTWTEIGLEDLDNEWRAAFSLPLIEVVTPEPPPAPAKPYTPPRRRRRRPTRRPVRQCIDVSFGDTVSEPPAWVAWVVVLLLLPIHWLTLGSVFEGGLTGGSKLVLGRALEGVRRLRAR